MATHFISMTRMDVARNVEGNMANLSPGAAWRFWDGRSVTEAAAPEHTLALSRAKEFWPVYYLPERNAYTATHVGVDNLMRGSEYRQVIA
jgi:hypothetical protein